MENCDKINNNNSRICVSKSILFETQFLEIKKGLFSAKTPNSR